MSHRKTTAGPDAEAIRGHPWRAVTIGVSAGGLAALLDLLPRLPRTISFR